MVVVVVVVGQEILDGASMGIEVEGRRWCVGDGFWGGCDVLVFVVALVIIAYFEAFADE